jgi:DNA modification methylase
MSLNKLILGDNLEILKQLDSESVDLIYLDPPFFSNRNYEVIWGDEGEVRSFKDRWSGGMDHYIGWLKERVEEMHRILKPTGSIFLHCDWHANSWIRVEILDRLFGGSNFRGEIIWQRAQAHNDAKKKLAVLSDSIFYFTKSQKYVYSPVFTKLGDTSLAMYKEQDERGQFQWIILTAPNTRKGESGMAWKGYDPTTSGRSWAVPNMMIEELVGKEKCKTMGVLEKLELLNDKGYIRFSENGIPRVKKYLEQSKGVVVGNIWTDIGFGATSNERIGYPTQKPEALMERIIRMASNEDDVVLDPFVGGGTTVAVADKLQRKWIGIDQSVQAIKVTQYRLDNQRDLMSQDFTVQLHKYDYDTLRNKDAFAFESWIIGQFGGTANTKQRSDFGLDGKHHDGAPIQVKRSDGIGRNVIDNLFSALQRFDKKLYEKKKSAAAPAAYLIAFSFSKGAVEEVARLKSKEGCIIKLVAVEDIVPIAKKPTVKMEITELARDKKGVRELKLHAEGVSEAGIEFFSWDWDYDAAKGFKPEVLLDRIGTQEKHFKPGNYTIAVMAVDAEGLEGIEVVKLKVNGTVERS